jgi:hypothetical protein
MRLYPNPAMTMCTLDLPGVDAQGITASICDLTGRELMPIRLESAGDGARATFSVAGLSEGMYLVNLIQNNHLLGSKKLIIAER